MEDLKIINLLKEYYEKECSHLVFVSEKKFESDINAKIYLYNFSTIEELKNFKKIFQEYLVYYVKNYDQIETYRLNSSSTISEISQLLLKKGKELWNSKNIPKRKTESNGIFGELYNDYYLRHIIKEDRLLGYLFKMEYGRQNTEIKGTDIVTCGLLEDETLEITLSEAKFYSTDIGAKNSLVSDMKHVSKEYINQYTNFVFQRQIAVRAERTKIINDKINLIIDKIENDGRNFIDAINELNYTVKFVFFAIFQNNCRDILKYESKINDIISAFNTVIVDTGIKKYNIEIVFIPTFNTSMDLKSNMEVWNE